MLLKFRLNGENAHIPPARQNQDDLKARQAIITGLVSDRQSSSPGGRSAELIDIGPFVVAQQSSLRNLVGHAVAVQASLETVQTVTTATHRLRSHTEDRSREH
jgi:hypothetical protein